MKTNTCNEQTLRAIITINNIILLCNFNIVTTKLNQHLFIFN